MPKIPEMEQILSDCQLHMLTGNLWKSPGWKWLQQDASSGHHAVKSHPTRIRKKWKLQTVVKTLNPPRQLRKVRPASHTLFAIGTCANTFIGWDAIQKHPNLPWQSLWKKPVHSRQHAAVLGDSMPLDILDALLSKKNHDLNHKTANFLKIVYRGNRD